MRFGKYRLWINFDMTDWIVFIFLIFIGVCSMFAYSIL